MVATRASLPAARANQLCCTLFTRLELGLQVYNSSASAV
jgi:hypothetical protein